MRTRTKLVLAVGTATTALAIGTGIGIAASGDDDRPLTGGDLERATEAALAHVGGGTVIETEVGDDGAAYGVEVRLPDGRVVEVALDAGFGVVGQVPDDDTGREDEGSEEGS
jgi:hypothetical protein